MSTRGEANDRLTRLDGESGGARSGVGAGSLRVAGSGHCVAAGRGSGALPGRARALRAWPAAPWWQWCWRSPSPWQSAGRRAAVSSKLPAPPRPALRLATLPAHGHGVIQTPQEPAPPRWFVPAWLGGVSLFYLYSLARLDGRHPPEDARHFRGAARVAGARAKPRRAVGPPHAPSRCWNRASSTCPW